MARLFKYSIPLAWIAFCWLTMRTVTSSGSESMTSYGFPFAWYAATAASSMAYDAAVGPFIVDLLLYIVASHLAVSFALRRPTTWRRAGRVVAVLLWVAAVASLAVSMVWISADLHPVGWALDDYFGTNASHSRSVHVGPGR